MVEISVKVSNDEQSYTQKFLVYDSNITLSKESAELHSLVETAVKNFKGNVDDVRVTARMQW